jgi:tetratricopeptide (TPR) repeat protein
MVDTPENDWRRESAVTRLAHRELLVLIALAVIAAVTFLGTRAAAHANRTVRERDARTWFETGLRARRDGHVDEAISAFRRATAIHRGVTDYRIALADSLTDAGQLDAAMQVLLRLRELTPEDPTVNLRLARVAAAKGQPDAAVRYYQNALYGTWAIDQTAMRLAARQELIDYLLERNQKSRALSELLVFAPNVPPTESALVALGDRFQRAGDEQRALDAFTRALRISARNERALAGAGRAAFAVGDYRAADRYLRDAPPGGELARLHETVLLVLRTDPLAPRVNAAERVVRARTLLDRAVSRLDACTAIPVDGTVAAKYAELRSKAEPLQRQLAGPRRRASHDQIEAAVDAADAIESEAGDGCGPAQPLDRAIVLIAGRHKADPS